MPLDFLPDILPALMEFFTEYGLPAMFVLLVLDGAMLIPVLPGEAVMIMAVTQYAESAGDLVLLVTLATLAGVLGAVLLYAIARLGGRPLIERHPRLFMMDRHRRESLEETFQKPLGQTLVAGLRVIPLTRIVVSIPAGLARMGLIRYIVLTAIGMAIFHTGFMWMTFKSQQSGSIVAEQVNTLQETYGTPAWEYLQANEAVAIIGALAIGAWISFRSSKRMLKHPRGSITSILGWLTVRLLVLGTLGLWGLMYWNAPLFFDVALAGGLDLRYFATVLGIRPVPMVAYTGVVFWSVGVTLWGLESAARAKRDQVESAYEREQAEEEDVEEADVDELSRFRPAHGEEGSS